MLDVLLSHETSEAEKRRILQDEYDIQMTRTMESEVSVMCNLSKGVMEKGIAKGMEKGRAEGMEKGILMSIRSLMETMGWTLDQAMTALKVPEAEQQTYRSLLEKQS